MLLEDGSVARPGGSWTLGQRTADRSENLAGLTNNLIKQIKRKERSNSNSAPRGELSLPKKPIGLPGLSPGIANAGMDRCRHVRTSKLTFSLRLQRYRMNVNQTHIPPGSNSPSGGIRW